MKLFPRQTAAYRRLAALCIALFLGLQAADFGHVHAGGLEALDCVLCQADGAQAPAAEPAGHRAAGENSHGAARPGIAPNTALHYRLPVRGPPIIS